MGDWNEPGDAKEGVEPGRSLLQVEGEVPPQERVRSHLQQLSVELTEAELRISELSFDIRDWDDEGVHQ